MNLERIDTKDVLQELITSVVNYTVDGTPFLETLNANWTDINFLYGNPDDNNNTIDAKSELINNPIALIFLPRGLDEQLNYDKSSNEYLNSNIKMYFLVGVDMISTDVAGHYSKAIDPCKEILNRMILNSDTEITSCKLIESARTKDLIQFGLVKFEYGKKGERILDGKFSGIEANFNLSIYKKLKC